MALRTVQSIEISTGTMIRFLLVLVGIAALYIVRDVVAALLFAVIIASAVEPAVLWLKARRVPRILSVIFIYLALFIALVFLMYLVVPLIVDEFRGVSITYPDLQQQVLSGFKWVNTLPFISSLNLDFQQMFLIPGEILQRAGGGALNFAFSAFGGAFTFLLIIVFSFYLAAQEKGIEIFLRLISPLRHEQYVIDVWARSQKKLGQWFRAQLLLGAIVGVLVFLGLTFLRVDHALFFAFLAAVFEIIPIAGPILAAVPAVIIGFLISPVLGVSVLILYVAVQQMESHVIIPVVMKKAVGLSPLIVVLAIIVGGKLGGIPGILLSVPVTAIAAEFLNDWDRKKRSLMPG